MKRVTILMGVILIAALSFGLASCMKKHGAAGPTTGAEAGAQSGASSSQSMGAVQGPQVDINTASAQDLQTVPGIDATLAQNIVSYRDANGPFASIDDLTKVQGMDMQKLESIRSNLTISHPGSSGATGGGTSGGTGAEEGMGSGGTGTSGTDTSGSGSGTGGTDTSGSEGTSGMGSGGDMDSGSGSSTGF